MADNGRVVVGCSHGEDNPDSVAVAYLTAGAALDQGRDVVLWLSSEGVRLGIRGYADGIRVDMDPPGARLHKQFITKTRAQPSPAAERGARQARTQGAWCSAREQTRTPA